MKKKIFWWGLVAIWCIFIFYQSSKSAVISSQESGYITMLFSKFIDKLFSEGAIVIKDGLIRKSAHFFEYMLLAVLLFNALKNVKRLGKTFVLSVIFALAYAISDEIHQFFIPGRAMRIFDIGIDFLGIICGAGILFWYTWSKNTANSRI